MNMRRLEGCLLAELEIEVRSRSGKIIRKKRFRSKSFVSNFLKILRTLSYGYTGATSYTMYFTSYSVGIKDHTGSDALYPVYAETRTDPSCLFNLNAPVGDANYGIRVGSGSTPPTANDYNLANPIANGSGSGQLLYGATTIEPVVVEDSNKTSFRIIRTFSNSSGGTVTVCEIGLSVKWVRPSIGNYYALLARDVLSTPVDVPDGATLTVRYILSTTT
jgi:hypothetical protein